MKVELATLPVGATFQFADAQSHELYGPRTVTATSHESCSHESVYGGGLTQDGGDTLVVIPTDHELLEACENVVEQYDGPGTAQKAFGALRAMFEENGDQ